MSHLVSLCLISPTLNRRSLHSVSLCAARQRVGSCKVALPHWQVPAFTGGLTWKVTAKGDSLVKQGCCLSVSPLPHLAPPGLLQLCPCALANTQKSALLKSLPWLPIAFRTTISAGEFAGSAEETHCKNDTLHSPQIPAGNCVGHGGLPGARPCAEDKQRRKAWALCLRSLCIFHETGQQVPNNNVYFNV